MFDQSYGLRFDIYERIQLSEDAAGIAELEEIELLPHIQVISKDEQAALRGHLLLTGLYRGDGEEDGTLRLEHWIPVEITVPLNRVTSLDEIAVEIENFDVDLLSERSLNITGVLSLRGIESIASEQAVWVDDEFTVVHSPSPLEDLSTTSLTDPEDSFILSVERDQKAPVEPRQDFAEPILSPAVDVSAESGISAVHTDKESFDRKGGVNVSDTWHFEHEDETELLHPEHTAVPAEPEEEHHISLTGVNHFGTDGRDPIAEPAQPFNAFNEPDVLQAEEHPEEREPRIALGSKREDAKSEKDAIGISSLLSSSRSIKELEDQAAQEELQAVELEREREREASEEDVKWKNRFLGLTEKTPFRKMRLCIVQREETIETIADRYQLSTRELLLYNRLSEQTIEEGQILYIP